KSPVKRIGRNRFVRNVLIAIGNSADPELAAGARRLLGDANPLVRGAAVWALSQVLAPDAFRTIAARALPAETDDSVRAEWTAALEGCSTPA
ncbi:MAG: HEAT repeat domain-containing protein, partial [Bradyrhizobium sp.]|nr:HEAT repeat domain-containing protein [Bradyrhizobium sp.]